MSKACVTAPGRISTTEEIVLAFGVWIEKALLYPSVEELTLVTVGRVASWPLEL